MAKVAVHCENVAQSDLELVKDIKTPWRNSRLGSFWRYSTQRLFSGKAFAFPEISLPMTLINSGDDHDYCEYVHEIEVTKGTIRKLREISVKSISMVMNVRRPGFQLLSLLPSDLRQEGKPTHADTPCVLPDQMKIYLERYLPLIAISLLAIFTSNVIGLRRSSPGGSPPQLLFATKTKEDDDVIELDEESNPLFDPSTSSTSSSSVRPAGSTHLKKTSSLRANGLAIFGALGGGRDSENNSLLSKILSTPWVYCSCTSSSVFHRRRRLWYRCLCDVTNVAVVPLCVFVVITWWTVSK